jgi:hypothetical protein
MRDKICPIFAKHYFSNPQLGQYQFPKSINDTFFYENMLPKCLKEKCMAYDNSTYANDYCKCKLIRK